MTFRHSERSRGISRAVARPRVTTALRGDPSTLRTSLRSPLRLRMTAAGAGGGAVKGAPPGATCGRDPGHSGPLRGPAVPGLLREVTG